MLKQERVYKYFVPDCRCYLTTALQTYSKLLSGFPGGQEGKGVVFQENGKKTEKGHKNKQNIQKLRTLCIVS